MHYYHYPTPHGMLTIAATEKGICLLDFGRQTLPDATFAPNALTNAAATQIQEYLAGKRFSFDVPLDLAGSDFQKAVWTEVTRIPYGATCSPSDIARAVGRPGAHRSVGAALSKNPVAILVPDHRVTTHAAKAHADARAKTRAALLAHELNTPHR